MCEDLTWTEETERKQQMEKQLLFFISNRICTLSVMCQKNKSCRIQIEAVLRRAAPPAERTAELCSFLPAEQSRLHP